MHTGIGTIGSCAKSGLVFVMHQVIGTEGVIWLTTLGAFLLTGSLRMLNETWAHFAGMRGWYLILTNTPFFPVQIGVGAYLG